MSRIWLLPLAMAVLSSCKSRREPPAAPPPVPVKARPPMPWDSGAPLEPGQTFALDGPVGRRDTIAAARARRLLDVDLGDNWAPFIFSESDGAGAEVKPNEYRQTFIALANDRFNTEEIFLQSRDGTEALFGASQAVQEARRKELGPHTARQAAKDKEAREREEKRTMDRARRYLRAQNPRNYLEAFGIPPTLSVLLARVQEDASRTCYDQADSAGLAGYQGPDVTYQTREQARRDYSEAMGDAAWVEKLLAVKADAGVGGAKADAAPPTLDGLRGNPKVAARIDRYRRGQNRLRVVRAVQGRLLCEGLLSPRSRYTDGMFDLATHEALAEWERKNDIFGWGMINEETLAVLRKPPLELHFETWKRILDERIADAAGIIEDGSTTRGKQPATYKDAAGVSHPVRDVIAEHTGALLARMGTGSPNEMKEVLQTLGRLGPAGFAHLHVAIAAPPLPEYYGPNMDLVPEIDRGDVWYDFPFDEKGRMREQRRDRFPHLLVFVRWRNQKILLARWRTTIGSWRSELHPDGRVYYKYKKSDVGPRIWKNIVAAPVWIPPDGTPGKDLLTRKVLDPNVGALTVVDTDVMGPGFGSAYGLVMAIHLQITNGGGLFDNQIRTHGSVDYTSIARRFSHGCHRLVNNRAVRLFGFVLKHRHYQRLGNQALHHLKRRFTVEGKEYEYEIPTRGYYYELTPPVPVMVHEGRIKGILQKPIMTYVRKPGVDYGTAPQEEGTVETEPEVGP